MPFKIEDPAREEGRFNPRPEGWNDYDIKITDVTDPTNKVVVQTITVKPAMYLATLNVYAVLQIALGFAAYFMRDMPIADLGPDWAWGGLVFALQATHFILSFTYIRADEFGGFLFFGQPVMEIERGLKFRPLFLLGIKKCSIKVIQAQFPGDPEDVFKGSDEDFFKLSPEDRGKLVLPIRATTDKPRKKNETGEDMNEGILNTQMTLGVNFYVKWRILHFFVFLIRMGDVKEGLRQLRDSGERVIVTEIASKTPQGIVKNLAKINKTLKEGLSKITQDWGVTITEAGMMSPNLTHAINSALRDVADAKAKACSKEIEARAERVKLTQEGHGKASADLARLEAMAKGAEKLGVKPEQLVALEATRAISGEDNALFFDVGEKGGIGPLGLGARLVAGGIQAFNNQTHHLEDDKEKEGGNL